MKPPKVYVIDRGRLNLVLRYKDPRTHRWKEQSAGTANRDDAMKEAGKLEEDLASRSYTESPMLQIVELRYRREILALQRAKSVKSFSTAMRKFWELLTTDNLRQYDIRMPECLEEVNGNLISVYTSLMHEQGLATSSIRSYLRELRRMLRWARDIWPEYQPPRVRLPKVAKHDLMRGRPLSLEEFERMLAEIPRALTISAHSRRKEPRVPTPREVDSWEFLLWGLWHSGMRLGEAIDFWWDRPDRIHVYGIETSRPMLRFLAESEKGRQDRLVPITPQFAELLWKVPQSHRTGRVFQPRLSRGVTKSLETVSEVISRFGGITLDKSGKKKCGAGIVVGQNKQGKPEYASGQDLRRSFGLRLAPLIHPMHLKELMRHESLDTTLKYYVGVNALRTATDVWKVLCDQPCDIAQDAEEAERRKSNLPKNFGNWGTGT